MFNKELREEAIENYKSAQASYERESKNVLKDAEKLFEIRLSLKSQIDHAWEYINSMRNKPEQLDTDLKAIKIQTKKFSGVLEGIEVELEKANIASGGTAAAGVAAGVGVAAFGPAAAMAVATTFGTASTGAAIASLSGAAATNAALAWLGGGALAAGGGGMAAGSAFIGLAGPLGWTIGGGALLTAGLLKSGKNKKIAEEANNEAVKIKKHVKVIKGTRKEISEITGLCQNTDIQLQALLGQVRTYPTDFQALTSEQKQRLGAFVNNTKGAAELLNRTVGGQA